MKNGKSATIPESRSSKQIATNDDAAANEQEVEEQIREDNVEEQAEETRTRFRQRSCIFLLEDIRDALEEEQWEEVGLEVGSIYGAAQNISCFPQVPF